MAKRKTKVEVVRADAVTVAAVEIAAVLLTMNFGDWKGHKCGRLVQEFPGKTYDAPGWAEGPMADKIEDGIRRLLRNKRK